MARPKNSLKGKELIRLREKTLSNGNKSLYLDKYTGNGKRDYEFLRLYILPGSTPEVKKANAETLKIANTIKAQRIIEMNSGKAGIKARPTALLFTSWVETLISQREDTLSKSAIYLLKRTAQRVEAYRPGVKLIEIDRAFCAGFSAYLRTAKAIKTTLRKDQDRSKIYYTRKTISQGTQHHILAGLTNVLNSAVRAELIPQNPMFLLSKTERPTPEESTVEFLTREEVNKLMSLTVPPAEVPDLRAFLFCCFCGLRYSDVHALTWGDISEEDGRMIIKVTMQKTKAPVVVPLSRKAIEFLPDRNGAGDNENVFNMARHSTTENRLLRWAKAAGLKKKLTFHMSRHTFATLTLKATKDLATVQALVGHKSIRTTQIYTKV